MKRWFLCLLVLALFMSLSACSAGELTIEDAETAEPVGEAETDAQDLYAAYREIVLAREETYGVGAWSLDNPDYEMCWMYGVACVRLRDLDGDGVEELLLWENTLVNNFPAAAQIEVWTYADGEAKALYRGNARMGGDPSGQSLEFLRYDGEPMLVTGEAGGFVDLEFYALRDGELVLAHTLRMSDDNYDEYFFDGERISSDEAWDMVTETESLCNACVMTTAEAAAILRETEETRVVLGL